MPQERFLHESSTIITRATLAPVNETAPKRRVAASQALFTAVAAALAATVVASSLVASWSLPVRSFGLATRWPMLGIAGALAVACAWRLRPRRGAAHAAAAAFAALALV